MNPLQRIPDRVRQGLYLLYALLGPVLIWTASKGWTGDAEYALWVGIGTALGLTAASNVTPQGDEVYRSGDRIPGTTLPEDTIDHGVPRD